MNFLTTFYVVRHGETEWNAEGRIQGHVNSVLTKKGELQAKNLGKEFKDIHFDRVFSSDLVRAYRTAQIITLEKKLAVQTSRALRERTYGNIEGKLWADLRKTEEDLIYEYIQSLKHEDKWDKSYMEQIESNERIAARFITFLRETAVTYPGETILIVSHGGTMRAFLRHIGYINEKNRDIHIDNTAYVKVDADGTDFFVREMKGIS